MSQHLSSNQHGVLTMQCVCGKSLNETLTLRESSVSNMPVFLCQGCGREVKHMISSRRDAQGMKQQILQMMQLVPSSAISPQSRDFDKSKSSTKTPTARRRMHLVK